jgi:23S rRNA pseudouridine1911/1915/1917 synthase
VKEILITTTITDTGKRLDQFVAEKSDISRSYAKKLIDDGNVFVEDKNMKASYKIQENKKICVKIPEDKPLEIDAEDIQLDILYEDDDILVVNKPKGMVVHPAAGNYKGTLVNAIMAHCKDDLSGINGVIRPGIVHRIDKDTSGILVIAKNDKAHIHLANQLKEHSMKRIYVAVVKGVLKNDVGTINAPIGRSLKNRKKMAVVQNGKNAVTHYKVIRRFNDCTMIEVRLETGRTHQIRVHMSHIGYPLLGDDVYGNGENKYGFVGQALHAKTLGFIHPSTNEYMEFESDPPKEFQKLLSR